MDQRYRLASVQVVRYGADFAAPRTASAKKASRPRGQRPWGLFVWSERRRGDDENRGGGHPGARRDRDRRRGGSDWPRGRDRRRGDRSRASARHHARVPRSSLRVALPAEGRAHVRRRRRPGGGGRRGDRRRGAQRERVGRRDRLDDAGLGRHPQPNGTTTGGGGDRMTTKELTIATSTVWVLIAAILVMFMQAGFAFLEAGLTRMKNVGHIAAKNVLIFALASVVYFLVGYGLAFGDGGNGLVGGSGFFPSTDELLTVGEAPFSWFGQIPASAGYMFEVVFCGVSL